jgi:hypothetical protein
MLKELEAVGGYLCSAEEKAKLAKAMWDEKGALSREIAAQPAEKIAKVAGINHPGLRHLGGNSTSSNVTWEHLLNYTWVSYPIPSTQPSDVELFGNIMYED